VAGLPREPVRRLRRGRKAHSRARGGARQAEGLRVRGDVRPDRHGAMIRYGPALLSILVSLGAIAGYVAFLRVPTVRNHPELYLVAFALATLIAAAASWRGARRPNLVAPALSGDLLVP